MSNPRPGWRTDPVSRWFLRVAVGTFQKLRRAVWYFTEPEARGVHAIPITPDNKVILVKLTYARGWRLPGGGWKAEETAEQAILRELHEEIGLVSHSDLQRACEVRHRPDFRQCNTSLFVVHDVICRPGWSVEIEAVKEFLIDQLPEDTDEWARQWIERIGPELQRQSSAEV